MTPFVSRLQGGLYRRKLISFFYSAGVALFLWPRPVWPQGQGCSETCPSNYVNCTNACLGYYGTNVYGCLSNVTGEFPAGCDWCTAGCSPCLYFVVRGDATCENVTVPFYVTTCCKNFGCCGM
jgi:hypothetical protein